MFSVRGGHRALPFVFAGLATVARARAQERAIPFWPDAVPAAIHAEIDGVATLETVRELSRFHRVHGSPGFAEAAEHMRKKAAAAGLSAAAIERFPADGKTKYAHFRAYYGWAPVSAVLAEVSPTPAPHRRVPGSLRGSRRLQPDRRRHGAARRRGRGHQARGL